MVLLFESTLFRRYSCAKVLLSSKKERLTRVVLTFSKVLFSKGISDRLLRHARCRLAEDGPIRAHVRDVSRLIQRLPIRKQNMGA